jgi:hypothetical protein
MPKEQSKSQAAPSKGHETRADDAKAPNTDRHSVASKENGPESDPVAQPELSLLEMSRILEVASTLRKERTSAQKQLNLKETKALLRERLLETTKITGERLTSAEVDSAVEQYYDNLHTYVEPPWSFSVMLAHLYVRRAMLLRWLLAAVTVLVLIAAFLAAKETLEKRRFEQSWAASDRHAQVIVAINNDPQLASSLQTKVAQATAARERRDLAQLNTIEADLAKLEALYQADYQVVILNQPGTQSATERKYTDTDGTRTSGFYVFVEARNQDGTLRKMAIRNRETGKMVNVERWGEQVSESVFNRLAADKKADGVLDEIVFSQKRRGQAEETVVLPGTDGQPLQRRGQITSW